MYCGKSELSTRRIGGSVAEVRRHVVVKLGAVPRFVPGSIHTQRHHNWMIIRGSPQLDDYSHVIQIPVSVPGPSRQSTSLWN